MYTHAHPRQRTGGDGGRWGKQTHFKFNTQTSNQNTH